MTATAKRRRVSRPSTEVRLVIEEVTPERAHKLLGDNTQNRRIRQSAVAAYARDMTRGRWKEGAGEPIHVAPDGTLGNGQNRLLAVIEADVTIKLPFLYAPLDFRMATDQGAKRTFADILILERGAAQVTMLAAMTRMVRAFRLYGDFGRKAGGPTGERVATPAELLETYDSEPNLSASLWVASREGNKLVRARAGVIASVAATCHYLFNEVDPEEADEFFERLQSGTDLEEGSAILAARRWFANPDHTRSQRVQAAILIKAFNFWREGRPVNRITFRAGGSKPEDFPKINPAA